MWESVIPAWHGSRYDAVAGVGVYFPAGIFHKNNPALQGKGYFTFMPTLGGALYLDEEKAGMPPFLPAMKSTRGKGIQT